MSTGKAANAGPFCQRSATGAIQGPGEPGTASWLGQALQALGVDHDVKEYPGAGHAFLNDHDSAGDPNPVIFIVMGKFAGPSGYHERSAHDARRRILAFFCAHLK